MVRLYLLFPRSFLHLLLSLVTFLGVELQIPLTAQAAGSYVINHRASHDNRQKWVNYYLRELETYGTVRQLKTQRGASYDLRPKKAIHYHLRFITTEKNHQGYYPKVCLTYHDQSGSVLGVYISSMDDVLCMGNGQTFLQVDLSNVPTNSYRTTLTVLEGEGTILSVFE